MLRFLSLDPREAQIAFTDYIIQKSRLDRKPIYAAVCDCQKSIALECPIILARQPMCQCGLCGKILKAHRIPTDEEVLSCLVIEKTPGDESG